MYGLLSIISVHAEKRIPRTINDDDYDELFKLLEEYEEITLKRKHSPNEKRVYRMYKCSKYKVEEYTDPLSGEIKRGIVSLHFALHYSVKKWRILVGPKWKEKRICTC